MKIGKRTAFILYELNPDLEPLFRRFDYSQSQNSLSHRSLGNDRRREANNGIICANRSIERPDGPEAFHLIHNKTRLSYTLEAPVRLPLLNTRQCPGRGRAGCIGTTDGALSAGLVGRVVCSTMTL
jgi:hypothetical protein